MKLRRRRTETTKYRRHDSNASVKALEADQRALVDEASGSDSEAGSDEDVVLAETIDSVWERDLPTLRGRPNDGDGKSERIAFLLVESPRALRHMTGLSRAFIKRLVEGREQCPFCGDLINPNNYRVVITNESAGVLCNKRSCALDWQRTLRANSLHHD